jgi:hypothetical protein
MKYTYAFVLIALTTAFATPASAQYDPTVPREARQQQSKAHVFAPDLAGAYARYYGNNNANPDFQLGGSRWKTNSKAKRTRRHASASQK